MSPDEVLDERDQALRDRIAWRYRLLVDQIGEELGYRRGWMKGAAERLRISQSYLTKIRSGERTAGPKAAFRASHVLGISRDFFMAEAEPGTQAIRRAIERLSEEPADLHHIANEAASIAAAKGFDRTTPENAIGKMALIFTELVEVETAEVGCIGEELADTAIRILTMLSDLCGRGWCSRIATRRARWGRGPHERIEVVLAPCRVELRSAIEAWRKGRDRDVTMHLELMLLEVYRAADRLGVDLTREILAKLDGNRSRPRLHGRTRSLG
jgi:transcriptional regulator with XRE-family HTH domain